MAILRKKDKWKRQVIWGVASVKPDRDGNIYTESEPDKFTGLKKLRFKINGGYKRSADDSRWLRQDVNCFVWENHPLAPIVRKLEENDAVDVMGVMRISKYISSTTGAEKKYYEVSIDKIVVLYHGNGDIAKPEDFASVVESDCDDDDEFDF